MKERGFHILRLQEVDSTNVYAVRLLKSRRPEEMTVIAAEYQHAGKGQGGNAWHSMPSENLLFSIIFYPGFLLPLYQFYLSKVVALGIKDVLAGYAGEGVCIKWPNDIYFDRKKIGGILIENSLCAGRMEWSVAGVGLNINQCRFPSSLPHAVSLRMITGEKIEREKLLQEILFSVGQRYEQLKKGMYGVLNDHYDACLLLKGRKGKFSTSSGQFEAIVSGVSVEGELLLQVSPDLWRSFGFKEVEFMG